MAYRIPFWDVVWERRLHQHGSVDDLAVAGDLVVVHERGTRLVCLDRHDGSVRWDVPVGTWPRAVVVAGDRCLVLPQDTDQLCCLDLATGAVRWRDGLRWFTGHAVAVGETVIVGGWRGYTPVAAFDLESGRPLWRTPRRLATALPSPWGDGVLLGSGTEVWLADPRDGRELARWRLPEPLAETDRGRAFTVVDADRCLVRCGPRSVVCLRRSSGLAEELFRNDDDLLSWGPELSGGVVWLRAGSARYVVVDPAGGTVLWRVDTGQPFARGVVRDGAGFVLAGLDGMLFRLGSDGRILRRSWSSARRVAGLRDLGSGEMLMATKGTLRLVAL